MLRQQLSWDSEASMGGAPSSVPAWSSSFPCFLLLPSGRAPASVFAGPGALPSGLRAGIRAGRNR